MTEYKAIIPPKIDWKKKYTPPRITKEIEDNLRNAIEALSDNGIIDPNAIKEGLKSIDFHKDYPEIYKIIEDFARENDIDGEEKTADDLIDYITEKIGNTKSREAVNILFDSIADSEAKAITPKEIFNIINELEGDLTLDEVKQMMKDIADPAKNPNINLDELYYIMTRKPSEVIKINEITKEQE